MFQNLIWEINPDLDPLIQFEEDIYQKYTPTALEKDLWLIWFLDDKVNPLRDKVWAFSCRPKNFKGQTFIDKGRVVPKMKIIHNPDISYLNLDIDKLYPAFWQCSYETGWKLDPAFCHGDDNIYVIKFRPSWKDSEKNWEWLGTIVPEIITEYNPDLPKTRFEFDDCEIPLYQYQNYEHIWYLKRQNETDPKIWAFKKYAKTGLKKKDMGITSPIFPPRLDVFFLSYYEKNADLNWNRLLEKAPHAKRIDGIKGIAQAHRVAAAQSQTDMFYVVDADAYIVDDFDFDFQPELFDRDCTHVWYSKNPINGLIYGYGGVKLFSKYQILQTDKWITLDYSTKVTKKLKVIEKISNFTNFNTDPFTTWRSAFRECIKLLDNIKNGIDVMDSNHRFKVWATTTSAEFSDYAVKGAQDAREFIQSNPNDLLKINDRQWLEIYFNKKYHE